MQEGLRAATTLSYGTSVGVFGSFPVPISGKTGTAEKVVDGVLRDQSWWCGYGPRWGGKSAIALCVADRERRLRRRGRRAGGAEGARGALRRQGERRSPRCPPTDGRLRLLPPGSGHPPGPRPPLVRAAARPAPPRRRRRDRGLRHLGRRRHHALRRRGRRGLLRDAPADRRGHRLRRAAGRARDRPGPVPPRPAAALRGHDRAHAARLSARGGDARLAALDRPRAVPVPAVGVRQAPLRPRPRRLPRRPRAPAEPAGRRAAGGRARRSSRSCSSSGSPTSARPSSTSPRSSRASSSRAFAGRT